MVASGQISRVYDWKEELLTENLCAQFLTGAWLYETTHLVMWNVPQAHKCVSPADLTRRFARLRDISEGRLWAATPDEVIDYVMLRRALSLNVLAATEKTVRFELAGTWPVGVIEAKLTLRVKGLDLPGPPQVRIVSDSLHEGSLRSQVHSITPDGGDWLITMDVLPGRVIEAGQFAIAR